MEGYFHLPVDEFDRSRALFVLCISILSMRQYTIDNTPAKYIKEIIVVDDASEVPLADVLDKELPQAYRRLVKVYRFENKEGRQR